MTPDDVPGPEPAAGPDPGSDPAEDAAVDPADARQVLAERHFLLSQAVIDRYEELLPFLKEARQALEASGHGELARRAADELERTREELAEWQAFRDEVAGYLEGGEPEPPP